MVFRRDIQDERDRLPLRAALWRRVAIVVSRNRRGQRPPYRFPFRLELSRRNEAAAGRLLAALPAARLLLHVPALQRGTARPHLRPRPRCELHFRVHHPSGSHPWPRLGVPHASPRAPRRQAPFPRGARHRRNGDFAAAACDQDGAFRRLPELRLGRRRLDLQFAFPRLSRQLTHVSNLASRSRRRAAFGAAADRNLRLSICDRRLSRGAVGLSAAVPGACHHGGHPALVESRSHAARFRPRPHGAARALLPRLGFFHSRRRWSVPGRCGTGAIRAIGICSGSALVLRPACFCFCPFLEASERQAVTCRWRSSAPTRTRRSSSS